MTAPSNKGRIINFVTGISGVNPGGNALVNIAVNQRIHRIVFQCAAVNYVPDTASSGTAAGTFASGTITGAHTVTISGSGSGMLVNIAITNGVVSGATWDSGGTGYATGDTFTIENITGVGFIGRVTAQSGGVPSAVAVSVSGTQSPIDPTIFATSLKLLVNGVNMRDISPSTLLAQLFMVGYPPQIGNLPLYFTEPWRNIIRHNELTSWDLFQQGTFQIQIGINPSVTLPSLNGFIEFDYLRNGRTVVQNGKQVMAYFLAPISHHSFTQQLVAGRNDVNQLPWTNPIDRIWIAGEFPGNIYQLEVYQDGNKILEATQQQIQEAYAEYGITFAPLAQNQYHINNDEVVVDVNPVSTTVPNGIIPANAFDVAFLADPDQRLFKALKCASSLNVRVYCNVAQAVTFFMEALPGAYSA